MGVAATPPIALAPASASAQVPAGAVTFAPGWGEEPAVGGAVPDSAARKWISGRLAVIGALVLVLTGGAAVLAQVANRSSKDGALPASTPSSSPSAVATADTPSPSAAPTAASPTARASQTPKPAPKTTAPASSPFYSPELKVFGAGWQPGLYCESHHASPARALDASSCTLSPAPMPDLAKAASRRVTAFMEQYAPGTADKNMGCGGAGAYPIPGMATAKVDQPGTTGNRAGFYCETTGNFTDNGTVIGACTYIMWTSGDNSLLGMLYNCFRFSDEGSGFRPTTGMLAYMRNLWNARA